MKVVNVCGFDFRFDKEGKTYTIPNDGQLHIIPDDCYFEDDFNGLLRVIVPPTDVKAVLKRVNAKKAVDINDEDVKKAIEEELKKKNEKPLKGKKIKPKVRAERKHNTFTKETTNPDGKKRSKAWQEKNKSKKKEE